MASPAIGLRSRWTPGPSARVDWSHPLAQGLVLCTVDAGGTQVDVVNRRVAPGRGVRGTAFGSATAFDGNQTSTSSFPVRMGGSTQMTFRWFGTWSSFANNDNLAAEYSANANNTTGFFFDPNSQNPTNTATIKFGDGVANGSRNSQKSYNRWSANEVVHISASNDFGTTAGHVAYFNGNIWTVNATQSTPTQTGTVADDSVYVMSRAGASLKASGSVVSLAIWKRVLSPSEHAQLAADPFCMLRA